MQLQIVVNYVGKKPAFQDYPICSDCWISTDLRAAEEDPLSLPIDLITRNVYLSLDSMTAVQTAAVETGVRVYTRFYGKHLALGKRS